MTRCRIYDCIDDEYCRARDACCAGDTDRPPIDATLAAWTAFAARVTLTYPFRVDVTVQLDSRPLPHGDRVQVGVELHVPERDTREIITVHTRQHVGPWVNDEDGVKLLFDLLRIALQHETNESVRLDGKLVRDTHKAG